ncbi:MAG TPA: hypothetical protein VF629_18605 [Hymenobacter sp.]|jgi:hypothetical protein|uniref:hypothetical protein n=1 Tax=Hymenobacter sp. TaxID=1898978 RepID=UPI002ED7DC05
MKSLFLSLPAALLLATALGACKKQPAECPQLTRAAQAFLDYWYFPEGSSWVYQLKGSRPAVYDTMRVIGASESHLTDPSGGDPRTPCVQSYSAAITHSNRTYFPGPRSSDPRRLGTEYLASSPLFHGEDWVMEHSLDVQTLYPPEVGFAYPVRLAQKIFNRLTFVDTAAVTVPAGTFRQSVHGVPDYGSRVDSTQGGNWIRHLYRSRYVGITKVIYTNNQTWELVTFTIKR